MKNSAIRHETFNLYWNGKLQPSGFTAKSNYDYIMAYLSLYGMEGIKRYKITSNMQDNVPFERLKSLAVHEPC